MDNYIYLINVSIKSLVLLIVLLPSSNIVVTLRICSAKRGSIVHNELATDRAILVAFRDAITSDPYRILANGWSQDTSTNNTWSSKNITNICGWTGVSCGTKHQRVTALNFSGFGLEGTTNALSHLGNLTFLRSLDIGYNNFTGVLPPQLSRLRRLRVLNAAFNSFSGEVPSWLGSLPEIWGISLRGNGFSGRLPTSLFVGNHTKKLIRILDMGDNQLSGEIPPEIANLSNSLQFLNLRSNYLTGNIPHEIFNMSEMRKIWLSNNSLTGPLPTDICDNIPKIESLNLYLNRLSGWIPSNIYKCRGLESFQLSVNQFSGVIPSEIRSLSMLRILALGTNGFTGGIPAAIGNLSRLEWLGLSDNLLTGKIPSSIFNISSLQHMDLQNNSLTGSITSPDIRHASLPRLEELILSQNQLSGEIGSSFICKSLSVLVMNNNKLTGGIPKQLANLTALRFLYLFENNLSGNLPEEFGNLERLEEVQLHGNALSGSIPTSVFNISTLQVLDLSDNHFSGNIILTPKLSFPNLEELYLHINQLEGEFPSPIFNASKLTVIDMGKNSFSGSIPNTLGNLRFLRTFSIISNNFTTKRGELSFFSALTNSRSLEAVDISSNPLKGFLPASIGNLSASLRYMAVFECNIIGTIPADVGNLRGLEYLEFEGNQLTGSIPSTLGNLKNLQGLYFARNSLRGHIPNSICRINGLGVLSLANNLLSGPIHECLGEIKSLREIYLEKNELSSTIPLSLWNLPDLTFLNLSVNSLNGSLSSEVGNLKVVNKLGLSSNMISGNIPSSIDGCQSLEFLSLANNRFQGSIPQSLGNMRGLVDLDLSNNSLSGMIPKSLQDLNALRSFNVSYNNLVGEIPLGGAFLNFSAQSFVHNFGLCGPTQFHVPPCIKEHRKSRMKTSIVMVKYILGPIVLITIIIVAILMRRRKRNKLPTIYDTSLRLTFRRITYQEIQWGTNNFSEANLLGRGGFGSVFKCRLPEGSLVAIKVFNLLIEGATKSFDTECEALSTIRHRNLLKTLGCCSNPEFKALVLEYMPNGSLDKWLHSYAEYNLLDLSHRLNITIDVALALEYLHHDHPFPIAHCDIKPSNVFLDEYFTARVGDFGISKLFFEEDVMIQTNTMATIGYMAPEYGSEGKVSTRGDVYSYGIMLLEILTGKKPTDDMFHEEMSLKHWVNQAIEDQNSILEILVPGLLAREDRNFSGKMLCVSSMFDLAMKCLEISPQKRVDMKHVVATLKNINARFLTID